MVAQASAGLLGDFFALDLGRPEDYCPPPNPRHLSNSEDGGPSGENHCREASPSEGSAGTSRTCAQDPCWAFRFPSSAGVRCGQTRSLTPTPAAFSLREHFLCFAAPSSQRARVPLSSHPFPPTSLPA